MLFPQNVGTPWKGSGKSHYLIAIGILIKTILKNIGRNDVKFVKEI
jgi:hypothetical protein